MYFSILSRLMVASIFVRSFEKIFKLKSKITSKSDQCGWMSKILCHRIELTESVTNLSSLMSWIQFYFNYHILNEFQWHFELALKLAQCNDILTDFNRWQLFIPTEFHASKNYGFFSIYDNCNGNHLPKS